MTEAHHIPEFDLSKYPDAHDIDPKASLVFFRALSDNKPLRLNVVTITPAEPKDLQDAQFYNLAAGSTGPVMLRSMLSKAPWVQPPYNIYYCPNEASVTKQPSEADITSLRAVVVDVDPMAAIHEGLQTARLHIKQKVHAAIHSRIPPSYVIDTGNGAQLIYFLDHIEATPEAIAKFIATTKTLTFLVGGDQGDPRTANSVSHLFRVPATLNVATKKKKAQGLGNTFGGVWHASDRRYSLDALYELAGSPPPQEPSADETDQIDGLTRDMLLGATDRLDKRIDIVIDELLQREAFRLLITRLEAGEGEDRSGDDFQFCIELMEAGLSLVDTACALAHYGAKKAHPIGETRWERYIVNTVLNAKKEVRKPAEEWFQQGDETVKEQQEEPPKTHKHVDFTDLVKRPLDTSYLIKNLLGKRGVSMLYGPPKVGKSLVALELASSIASGEKFAGRMTKSSGLVVYVLMEGQSGLERRVKALDRHRGRDHSRLKFLPYIYNLYNNATEENSGTQTLLRDLRAISAEFNLPIDLVVIDMLVLASGGAKENSDELMVVWKNIVGLEAALKSHFMVQHHTGKDASKGARGFSGSEGIVETTLVLDRDKRGKVFLYPHLQRNFEIDGRGMEVVVKSIHLGDDEDGEPVTGAVVDVMPSTAKRTDEPLSEAEMLVLDTVESLQPCTVKQVAEALGKAHNTVGTKIRNLHKRGLIHEMPPFKGTTAPLYCMRDYQQEQTDADPNPFK